MESARLCLVYFMVLVLVTLQRTALPHVQLMVPVLVKPDMGLADSLRFENQSDGNQCLNMIGLGMVVLASTMMMGLSLSAGLPWQFPPLALVPKS